MKGGGYGTNSHFSFPNSNVKPLGQVKSEMIKWGFLVDPTAPDDMLVLLDKALAKKPGAELLLNYSIDTETTLFPLFKRKKITVTGTAATMKVGSQHLKAILEKVKYKKQGK